MAQTESKMLPLKTKAPAFILPNVVSGKQNNLDELFGSQVTLIVFMCNHCPYVIHLIDALVQFSCSGRLKCVFRLKQPEKHISINKQAFQATLTYPCD